jgi:hypothetical protein
MGKKLGSIMVLLVGAGLMLYSMARTFHLLSATLPPGQEALAVIALLGFDMGLVAWTVVFLRGAEGGIQRAIALIMVLIDLVGVIAGFLGDTLLTSGDQGLLAAMDMGSKQTIVLVTAFVIAANIAGTIFYHLASPDNMRHMAEESARDKIQTQSLQAISQQANLLAAELAPIIAADWVRNMTADFTASLTGDKSDVKQLPQANPPQLESAKPSRLDAIKARLSTPAAGPQFVTMASDSPAPIVSSFKVGDVVQVIDKSEDNVFGARGKVVAIEGDFDDLSKEIRIDFGDKGIHWVLDSQIANVTAELPKS